MSIQPSVIVWTLLCFFVLMLSLNRFLFKPLLTLMHTREDKIAAGIAAGETAAQALEKEQEHFLAEKTERRAAANQAEEELLRQCRQEAKDGLTAAQATREAWRKEAESRFAWEREQAAQRLNAQLPVLTAALAEALLKK